MAKKNPREFDIITGKVWKPQGSRRWVAFVGVRRPDAPVAEDFARGEGEGASATVAAKRAIEDAIHLHYLRAKDAN